VLAEVGLLAFGKTGILAESFQRFGDGVWCPARILRRCFSLLRGSFDHGQTPEHRTEVLVGSLVIWLTTMAALGLFPPYRADRFDSDRVVAAGGNDRRWHQLWRFTLLGIGTPILYVALLVVCIVVMIDMRLWDMATPLAASGKRVAALVPIWQDQTETHVDDDDTADDGVRCQGVAPGAAPKADRKSSATSAAASTSSASDSRLLNPPISRRS